MIFHLLSILELGVWVFALISVAHYSHKKIGEWTWGVLFLYILFTTNWFENMTIFSEDGILGMLFPNL